MHIDPTRAFLAYQQRFKENRVKRKDAVKEEKEGEGEEKEEEKEERVAKTETKNKASAVEGVDKRHGREDIGKSGANKRRREEDDERKGEDRNTLEQ
jgi:hypothetical protein